MKLSSREMVYSCLAEQIGEWGTSKGTNPRQLRQWDEYFNHDDNELVRYLLERHSIKITRPLKEEIVWLKARLFDLTRDENR